MNCKYCLAEIEEGAVVCPVCGKELTEPEQPAEETVIPAEETAKPAEESVLPAEEVPAKKRKGALKVVAAVVAVLALTCLLTTGILYSMGLTDEVSAKLGNAFHSLKFWRENDLYYKLSYTVDDAAAEKKVDDVVATVGDLTLTNGELQAYYWSTIYNYLDYYGYYLSMMGIDVTAPLDQQIADEETGMSYQQMFLENAIESWRRYAMLYMEAKESGFKLDDEQQKYLDTFKDEITKTAQEIGYTDLEKFIDEQLFPGCSFEAYAKYNAVGYTALAYYDTLYNELIPDQAKIEAYYEEHKAEFEENKITKESGSYYDVRHILIEIEGGTKDSNGKITYSDADWEACRAKAQKLLDEYLAGETVDEAAFAALAGKHSADPGSNANGGLYSQLTKDTSFVEPFKNWYLDAGRKVGDTGLVKTDYGYHIMYFSGSEPIWQYEAKSMVVSENTDEILEDAQEKWPMEVDYKKIVLGVVDLSAYSTMN